MALKQPRLSSISWGRVAAGGISADCCSATITQGKCQSPSQRLVSRGGLGDGGLGAVSTGAQCRQKYGRPGTEAVQGTGEEAEHRGGSWVALSEPSGSGLGWLVESRSAGHWAPCTKRQHGHLFLHLSPVFFPCPYMLVFLWCHLSWLSRTFTCFRREATVFSSSPTRDSRFFLEEGLGEGTSFLGKAGLCLAGFSSG